MQLVGEGYMDDITLDNITSTPQSLAPEDQEGNMAEDDVSGRMLSGVLGSRSPKEL